VLENRKSTQDCEKSLPCAQLDELDDDAVSIELSEMLNSV